MILNNYYNYIRSEYGTISATSSRVDVGSYGLKNHNGGTLDYIYNYGSGNDQIIRGHKNRAVHDNLHIECGTGNTQPSVSDYNLTSPVSLTKLTENVTYTINQDNKLEITITGSYKNETGSAVTISEVGISKGVYQNDNSTETQVLLTKNLITPITVENNEVVLFTIRWTE